MYPDVKATGHDPLFHYFLFGADEYRNPSEKFDTGFYCEIYPDVAESKINPLIHFIKYGRKEGRICLPDYSSFEKLISSHEKKGIRINPGNRLKLHNTIKVIRKSGLFDKDYYLKTNPDISERNIDPLEHFCSFGWREMRNPNPGFDIYFYFRDNPDLDEKTINPLYHYIQYGRDEGRITKEIEIIDEELIPKADINNVITGRINPGSFRIAVVLHLYYTDLIEEIATYLKNIAPPFDLFVSVEKEKIDIVKTSLNDLLTEVNVYVKSFDNTGRDIGPFLSFYKDKLGNYDLVCKIHGKKSMHKYGLRNWRKFLLDNLLGSKEIVETIKSEFAEDPDLGLIFPLAHPYIEKIGLHKGWAKNDYQRLSQVFPNINLNKYKDGNFIFPAGSMFWFRPQSLQELNKLETITGNVEYEKGKEDGTLAHLIERLFGILPVESGYKIKSAYFPKSAILSNLKPVDWLKNSKTILFVSHDFFMAGAEILLLNVLKWFRRYTSFNVCVLALKVGEDGNILKEEFNKLGKVFIWEDMISAMNPEDAAIQLKENIGEVDLIYGNTVKSPSVYRYLKVFKAPFITHVHELEESIRMYTSEKVLSEMKALTNAFIPCSKPVLENLHLNHQIPSDKLNLVHEFIYPDININVDRENIRRQLDLPVDKIIIWGCGTIYWRKGVDLFIETANKLLSLGIRNFVFYWIGANHWRKDSEKYGKWEDWERYLDVNGLRDYVRFPGVKENPKRYFLAGDIFYLPAREDPYPLVCLEAAECEVPVVCFAEAGGMPDFVEDDAGIVVPYLNIDKAAEAIKLLCENSDIRKKKGQAGRKKLLQQHSSEIAVPAILNICNKVMNRDPLVSVIIPVYNQEKFIRDRIESVLNQTFRDYEIIIIDDCSTDMSYDVAKEFSFHPSVTILKNDENSGSVFKQWRKGIEKARGEFIWIAEGDDVASPDFLETLLPFFNNQEVGLAYSASNAIDEKGELLSEYYIRSGHYKDLAFPEERWSNDYIENAKTEVLNALSIRNTIPNASAVIMRRELLLSLDFAKCESFRTAGDWYAYINITKGKKICYSARHLNNHRIHSTSVVGREKQKAALTLPDYYEMHKHIILNFLLTNKNFDLMVSSVCNGLRGLWPGLSDAEFRQHYNKDKLYEIFTTRNS